MDGVPLWPFLYYCIRCGDLNAAVQVAQMSPYVHYTYLRVNECFPTVNMLEYLEVLSYIFFETLTTHLCMLAEK